MSIFTVLVPEQLAGACAHNFKEKMKKSAKKVTILFIFLTVGDLLSGNNTPNSWLL